MVQMLLFIMSIGIKITEMSSLLYLSSQPVLTRDACDLISTEYTKLRTQETVGSDKAKVI